MRGYVRRISSSLSFALLALFFLLVPATSFSQDVTKRSKLKVETPEYNFGTVTQGVKVTHEFIVKNIGEADLVIQKVIPSCGCTASSVSSDTIPPGGEGKIKVEFDTTGFSGEKLKTVRVLTNDLDEPAPLLSIKGIITPDVIVEPQSVFFGDIPKGAGVSKASKEVLVKIREGAEARIVNIKPMSPYLLVKEVQGSDQQKTFQVSLDPAAPVGEFRDRVIIELAKGKIASMNVPVFASIKGTLSLKPPQVSFGVIEGKDPLTRNVKLENHGEAAVSIREIKVKDAAVSASYKTIEQGKTYVIQIKVDPSKVTKDLRASIDIITDTKEEESLSLNIYGTLPPSA